jgi:hypothetical protein
MIKNNIIKKSTLVNIDSSYRTIYPKNICCSDCKTLSLNPLSFIKGLNIVNIHYPNHIFASGDNITIQNVEGISKTIINSIYLFDNFKYAMIVFESNDVESDYINNVNKLYCNIEIVGEQQEQNLIENLPFNTLIGVKQYLLQSDISPLNLNNIMTPSMFNTLYTILLPNSSITQNTIITADIITKLINQKCIFIELPNDFNCNSKNYIQINQVFKVSYLHVGGIHLGYLNANYPINNYNYQSSYEIYDVIDSNNFSIITNFKSYGTINGGGNNIIITKILNTLVGYPNADEYVINLKKNFNNVTNIELISTEFPYVDMIIKKDVNDKIYWKNIEDGSHVYSITIDEGFYSSETLLKQLTYKMNNLPRINNTIINKQYNIFDIVIESNIQKITFKPYNLSLLPNSLYITEQCINSENYYVLTVIHPNNFVEIGDTITISNSNDVNVIDNVIKNGNQIDNIQQYLVIINNSYINKDHIIYDINLKKSTYDIILGKTSNITLTIIPISNNQSSTITTKLTT